ncbi:MAG: prolyl oligopeptidase family serine peptidase [Acidimicrobiales bacterium]|jgi:prolyl oligopeptidase
MSFDVVPLAYPNARRGDAVDDYHGELVADPYRWLEDAGSAETAAFVAAENELTEACLGTVASRHEIRRQLTELWSFPRVGVPFERGGHWFQFRNSGLEDQQVLFVMESPEDLGRPLLDPNSFSGDGTVAVTALSVSSDGQLVAYATSAGGSDWRTWRIRRVADGADLEDVVEWSKYGGAAFLGDGSGFFYEAPDRPAAGTELQAESRNLRILLHRCGTPQAEDEVVFAAPHEPEWVPHPSVTFDGRYLVVSISRGTAPESRILVLDLERPALGLRPLVAEFASVAEVVANVGSRFSVLTEAGAPRRRLVTIDLDEAEAGPDAWREVIAECDDTLVSVRHCGGRLVCHYLENAHSMLRVFQLDGTFVREVRLPGFVSLFDGSADGDSVEGLPSRATVHFKVTSFLESGAVWSHHLDTGVTELVTPSAARLDAAEYVTEQVFAESADGTRVPLFVSRRRDVAPTGEVGVLLHGYGGFNIAVTPAFSVAAAVFMQRGGIFAEAVLRGGGEYGKSWHDDGRLASKQNVFDDFCACARYFCEAGWSRPGRVAISGGSNGGLLVGACLTQHPELFGAAVPEVGVLDMLRFHKFTIGWAWTSDFGDPDDPEQYPWLRAYSPLHHVVAGTAYPPTLVMTGDHDDRVVPGHSLKFAAALQAAVAGDPAAGPVLLRVETSAGHGAGKPTSKQIAERADFLAFLEGALGLNGSHLHCGKVDEEVAG